MSVRRGSATALVTARLHAITGRRGARDATRGGREPAVGIGKRPCESYSAHIRGHSSRAKAGAAGVSPPWLGRRICKNAFAKLRKTADGVLTNAGAIPFVKPRELTPPRSCCSEHAFVQRKSCPITDKPSRTQYRRGVRPAVGSVRRASPSGCGIVSANAVLHTTGGLRPRLLLLGAGGFA